MPLFTTRSRALRAWLCSAHCCMLLLTSPSTRADQLGLEAQPEAYASPTNMKQQIALTVRTSAVHGAGTASPIFVTLHGTHFSSPEMELFELDPATLPRLADNLPLLCDRDWVAEEAGRLVPVAAALLDEAAARAGGYWPFPSFRPAELRVEPAHRRRERVRAKTKLNMRKMRVLGRMSGRGEKTAVAPN